MTTFAVTDPAHTIAALNYALSNLGQGGGSGNSGATGNVLTVNTTSGIISLNGSTTVQAYYYQYVNIRYADSASGAGFTTSPTNKLYYGILNSSSSTPVNLNNPTSYQWELVTGGFGTTKTLFYSTLGGRQVQFTAATTIPSVFFNSVVNATPINLDYVTSTQALPQVVLTAYLRSNTAPSTPTGGTYDFGNLVFTPPSSWSNSVPTGNTAYYSSQNTFIAPVNGTTANPSLTWTTPVLTGSNGTSVYQYTVYQQANIQPNVPSGGSYNFGNAVGTPPSGWSNTPSGTGNIVIWSSTAQANTNTPGGTWYANGSSSWSSPIQFSGSSGATGERGFIPMGYVVTTQNPTTAPGNTNANLTAAFSASRTNFSAPIGTGYAPEAGDTASFTWGSNTSVNTVYTYSGTDWSLADGQIINGNVFVTGSVNASALNANDVYALNLRGGNVNVGTYAGTGYWFQASTGNAYVGGNLTIGNNATIGNNLTIGNSVTIGGLTYNGNLLNNVVTPGVIASNAVTVGTIANGAVTYGALSANSIQANAVAANTLSGNIIVANTLLGNTIIANTLSGNAIIANTISGNTIIANTISGNSLVANSITATQISSAYVYAGNITSFGATQGNVNSPGYWLAYNSGDAHFGGNVTIGANLNVSGLVTTGALNSNTVITTTMQPSTVSNFQAAAGGVGTGYVVVTNPVSGTAYPTDMSVNITTTQNNQPVYIYAGMQTYWNSFTLAANSEIVLAVSLFRGNVGITTDNYTFDSGPGGGSVNFESTTNFTGFTDAPPTPGTYNYYLSVGVITTAGSYSGGNVSVGFRNITTQTLKR